MVKVRLTEKRMNNRRFRKTEEAIFYAFSSKGFDLSTKEMIKEAGISRSTFYRHHQAVNMIIVDYEHYLMTKYSRMIKSLMARDMELRRIYFNSAYFILKHRKMVEVLMKGGDGKFIIDMYLKLRPSIEKTVRITREQNMIFRIYVSEAVTVTFKWIADGFEEEKIGEIVDDLMYLARTAKGRLKPLEDN